MLKTEPEVPGSGERNVTSIVALDGSGAPNVSSKPKTTLMLVSAILAAPVTTLRFWMTRRGARAVCPGAVYVRVLP